MFITAYCECAIERGVGRGKRTRVAFDDADAVGESAGHGQRPRSDTEIRGQIDHGHHAAASRSDPPRGPADAAADVEYLFSWLRGEQRDKILRRFDTAAVKVVHWRQRIRGDRRTGATLGAQRRQDPLGNSGTGVMVRHAQFGHDDPLQSGHDCFSAQCRPQHAGTTSHARMSRENRIA
jgi:hypothetical protein